MFDPNIPNWFVVVIIGFGSPDDTFDFSFSSDGLLPKLNNPVVVLFSAGSLKLILGASLALGRFEKRLGLGRVPVPGGLEKEKVEAILVEVVDVCDLVVTEILGDTDGNLLTSTVTGVERENVDVGAMNGCGALDGNGCVIETPDFSVFSLFCPKLKLDDEFGNDVCASGLLENPSCVPKEEFCKLSLTSGWGFSSFGLAVASTVKLLSLF